MSRRIAINGFGRIGRMVYRILENDPSVDVVAINDLTDPEMLAHLLRYDSVHRRFDADVQVQDGSLVVNGRAIRTTAERDPAQLGWGDLGVDLVLECTGVFRTRESLDDGVRFEGFTTAPANPGPFDVEIRVMHPTAGETVDTKTLLVGDPEQDADAVERPDPIHDVAGLLVPSTQTLFVIPEDRDAVLEVLDAQHLGDGVFVVDDGEDLVQFQVVEDAAPGVRAAERGPDLIEDTGKTRVYKNAQCGAAKPGFTSTCRDVDGGGSTHNVWEPWRRCERGESYCVERMAVVGTRLTYEFANCAPPASDSEGLKAFACR